MAQRLVAAFRHLNMVYRQLVNKPRRGRGVPLAMGAAIASELNRRLLLGAGNADISQAAFFFQAFIAGLIETALMGKQSFFPAGQEHHIKFEALGGVQRHQRDFVIIIGALGFHHQRDVFEITGQVFKLIHRAHQLFEVF